MNKTGLYVEHFTGLFQIMNALVPVFIIITVGFTLTKLEIIPKKGVHYLSAFVFKIALPCMLFSSLSKLSFDDIFHPHYILAYTAGSLLTFFSILLIAKKLRNKDLTTSTLIAIGSSFSNSGFIGYAILIQILGPAIIVPVALTVMIETMIMLPIGLAFADATNNAKPLQSIIFDSLQRLSKNPLIWGITLGTICAVSDFQLHPAIMVPIDKFGETSGTMALLVIGGTLVGLKMKGMKGDIIHIMIGKLFIHPLFVISALFLTPQLTPVFHQTAILLASMPMLSMFPILGIKYGMENRCAAALVITTALSFITISFWSLTIGVS